MRIRCVDREVNLCSSPYCLSKRVEYEGERCPVCLQRFEPERLRRGAQPWLIRADLVDPEFVGVDRLSCGEKADHYRTCYEQCHECFPDSSPPEPPPKLGEEWENLYDCPPELAAAIRMIDWPDDKLSASAEKVEEIRLELARTLRTERESHGQMAERSASQEELAELLGDLRRGNGGVVTRPDKLRKVLRAARAKLLGAAKCPICGKSKKMPVVVHVWSRAPHHTEDVDDLSADAVL